MGFEGQHVLPTWSFGCRAIGFEGLEGVLGLEGSGYLGFRLLGFGGLTSARLQLFCKL